VPIKGKNKKNTDFVLIIFFSGITVDNPPGQLNRTKESPQYMVTCCTFKIVVSLDSFEIRFSSFACQEDKILTQ